MLVLSRRAGESIVIGDDIEVTILESRGDQIRIGIKAPRSVRVHCSEVLAEIEETNKSASSPTDSAIAALVKAVTPPEPAPAADSRS